MILLRRRKALRFTVSQIESPLTNQIQDNPSNFPTSHRAPEVGNTVQFIPRAIDTLRNGGGMALIDGDNFLGWVRAWDIARITTRMSAIIPVRGKIVALFPISFWRLFLT